MNAPTRMSPLPRIPFLLAVGMVVASLAVVSGARFFAPPAGEMLSASDIQQSRLLRFARTTDGAVDVLDADTGEVIAHAGSEGFIPGVLRGLDRMRRTDNVSMNDAYRLALLSNGQLFLIDTATGLTLDLAAYGQNNAAVFHRFISPTGGNS